MKTEYFPDFIKLQPFFIKYHVKNHVPDLTLLRFFFNRRWGSIIWFFLLRRIFLPWR
jgi:hypothetical protein